MNDEFVILNGKAIKKEDATISIFDKAIFFDFAVYDSLKVIKGKPFFPKFHAERLLESAKVIGLEHNFDKDFIVNSYNLLIEKNKMTNGIIRVLFVGAGDKTEIPRLYMFVLGLTFYPEKFYKKGVKVITFEGERHFPQSKTTDLILNFLAYRKAQEEGALDSLLIDRGGFIREGTRTNFFAVKDGKIYTAPLSDVLEGITRKILMEIAKKNDLEVVEKKIKLADLDKYQEFFITSTSMNVMPVVEIRDKIVSKEVGPITKQLMKLFKDYYKKEVFNEECAE